MSKPFTNCHARRGRVDPTDTLCADMARSAQHSRCATGDHGILSDLTRSGCPPVFQCVEGGCLIRMSEATLRMLEQAHRDTGVPLHDLIRGAAREQAALTAPREA